MIGLGQWKTKLPFGRTIFLRKTDFKMKWNHQEERTDVLFIIKLYLSANRQFYKIILRLSLTAQDSAVA